MSIPMMSTLTLNSSSDSTTLSIPKLCDDGSNWSDYEPRIQRAMGSKGLWRHVEGTAIAPKLYALDHGILVLSDGKTPATDEQIEARESKILDYDKQEYLAQHVILSMTSTHVGLKIKTLKTAKEMWDMVKADATTKSTLFLLNAEDQLASMKLADNADPKTHLSELKEHFQLMTHRHDNLLKMVSTLSNSHFNTIIMLSLPESCHPSLQTITAAERTSAVLGTMSSKWMKSDDLIPFSLRRLSTESLTTNVPKTQSLHLLPMGRILRKEDLVRRRTLKTRDQG